MSIKLPNITPGPWTWVKTPYGPILTNNVNVPYVLALDKYEPCDGPDERAIAAVPALLEALKDVVEWSEASVRHGGKLSAGQVLGRATAFDKARAALLLAGATEEK